MRSVVLTVLPNALLIMMFPVCTFSKNVPSSTLDIFLAFELKSESQTKNDLLIPLP